MLMFTGMKNWLPFFAMVKLCQSLLAHRQPPAPHHIGPYGGSFLYIHQNDKR